MRMNPWTSDLQRLVLFRTKLINLKVSFRTTVFKVKETVMVEKVVRKQLRELGFHVLANEYLQMINMQKQFVLLFEERPFPKSTCFRVYASMEFRGARNFRKRFRSHAANFHGIRSSWNSQREGPPAGSIKHTQFKRFFLTSTTSSLIHGVQVQRTR